MRPTLARLLRQTSYAMSYDETRPHLASMFIERRQGELVFVTTAGHRLAKVCVPDDGEEFSVLVGRRYRGRRAHGRRGRWARPPPARR
ncbi:MAG: hypothetical protein IPF99_43535 [Deltaproteobacteria bacterium]|nr:hypothetical protein [Deltaproteobacteria bacterium]